MLVDELEKTVELALGSRQPSVGYEFSTAWPSRPHRPQRSFAIPLSPRLPTLITTGCQRVQPCRFHQVGRRKIHQAALPPRPLTQGGSAQRSAGTCIARSLLSQRSSTRREAQLHRRTTRSDISTNFIVGESPPSLFGGSSVSPMQPHSRTVAKVAIAIPAGRAGHVAGSLSAFASTGLSLARVARVGRVRRLLRRLRGKRWSW